MTEPTLGAWYEERQPEGSTYAPRGGYLVQVSYDEGTGEAYGDLVRWRRAGGTIHAGMARVPLAELEGGFADAGGFAALAREICAYLGQDVARGKRARAARWPVDERRLLDLAARLVRDDVTPPV